jgi:transcriptional regulator with XRE-family HTH domain
MMGNKSKLAKILNERGLTQKDFAELLYEKKNYLIHIQNLNAYCTGLKEIKTLRLAHLFAETLEIEISDII